MKNWSFMLMAFTAASLPLLASSPLALAEKSWTGSESNDWHLADNWQPAGVPSAVNAVLVDGAGDSTWPRIDSATGLGQAIVLGRAGQAQLTLGQTAVLVAESLLLAEQAGSVADLVIEGVVAGQLDLPAVVGGSGSARLVFRHNQSNYEFRRPSGEAVNTSGSLMLVHDEFSFTRLLGEHSHTGGTRVHRGDFELSGAQLNHPTVALEVAPEAANVALVMIRNGAVAEVGSTLVAGGPGSFASVQVFNNSTLEVNGELAVGVAGTAFVDASGGIVQAGSIRLGSDLPASGQAIITVLGAFGRVFVSGDVDVDGTDGLARFHLSSGGEASIGGDVRVGPGAGGSAELELGVVAGLVIDGQLNLADRAVLRLGVDAFSHPLIEAGSVQIAAGAAFAVPEPAVPPESGSVFTVLEAPAGISGTFSDIDLPAGWTLIQEPTRLRVALVESDDIFTDRFESNGKNSIMTSGNEM